MAERKQDKEFNHGYVQGYELAKYYPSQDPKKSIRERGIGFRTKYAVGFLLGWKHCKEGLPQKYFD